MCIYICICIDIYKYMSMHIYIYVYVYIYVNVSPPLSRFFSRWTTARGCTSRSHMGTPMIYKLLLLKFTTKNDIHQ